MEPGRREMIGTAVRTMVLVGAAGLVGGCLGLEAFLTPKDPPPTGTPCRVVTTWAREVTFTPDPVNGGANTPGLAGRLYLFGPEITFPMLCGGQLTVDLYDARPEVNEGKPVLLEQWLIDSATLQRLQKKDTIGWGYTLFLPWGTYRPEINRVLLKVRFNPVKGTPLFADPTTLTLGIGPAPAAR